MIWIGNHVSTSKGYAAMGAHELELGGNTFAFFPRNPRGGRSKTPAPEDVQALQDLMATHNFGPLVVHGAYTMNVCAAKPEVRANSREMLRDDLIRLQALPGNFYNFHPGCHVEQGPETGVELVANALVTIVSEVEEATGRPLANTVLLETMAGKGTEVGRSFEELQAIIDGVTTAGGQGMAAKLGVCLDTCHVWDGGYNVKKELDGILRTFDEVIGLSHLQAIHLNDSKNPCGSHKDRHEKLGMGELGADALQAVVRHPLLQDRPFILETPNNDAGYAEEIALVRSWMR